jgi:hypothetical protein
MADFRLARCHLVASPIGEDCVEPARMGVIYAVQWGMICAVLDITSAFTPWDSSLVDEPLEIAMNRVFVREEMRVGTDLPSGTRPPV